MPYKKNKKPQPLGKRLYKAGKYAYKHRDTAVKAFQLAKKVARIVNAEYKVHDNGTQSSSVGAGGAVWDITSNIVQGDGVGSRDGDSIKLMRLSGRVFITQNSSAQKTLVRAFIVRGKQERGTPLTVGDVVDNDYLGPKPWGKRFNSKIIYSKMYHMSNNGNSSLIMDWDFKLYGHTTYINNSADVQDGGLYVVFISNENTNHPTVNHNLRLTYTDN